MPNDPFDDFTDPHEKDPEGRLKRTWSDILNMDGWEYKVLRKSLIYGTLSGFAWGWFLNTGKNRLSVLREYDAKGIKLTETDITRKVVRLDFKDGIRCVYRLGLIPVVLTAVTLSSISYRNAVDPIDFTLLYGLTGGLFLGRNGLKSGLKGVAIGSGMGLLAAVTAIIFIRASETSVADLRRTMRLREYQIKGMNRLQWLHSLSEAELARVFEMEGRGQTSINQRVSSPATGLQPGK